MAERQVGERLSEQAKDRINWYVKCLSDLAYGGTVRGLSEARAGFDSALEDFDSLARQLAEAERELRREWWINHGHEYPVLYGDDGELQCTACPADFRRQPIEELRRIVFVARATRGIAPDTPASPAEGSEAVTEMEVQRARMWDRNPSEWTRYERELSEAYLSLARQLAEAERERDDALVVIGELQAAMREADLNREARASLDPPASPAEGSEAVTEVEGERG